jgi:Kef-type K+ transport system membrane component KefB
VSPEQLTLDAASTIAVCLAVAVVAVLVSDLAARWLPLPAVVLEIAGGIVVGPAVLGFAGDNLIVSAFSELGLAMLIFLAGYEIQVPKVAGAPMRSALLGWAGSLVVGLGAGVAVVGLARPEDGVSAGVLVGLVFTTTALGTVLPILRDAGDLETRFGSFILSAGAVGEFGPILAIALLLSGQRPARTAMVLVVFAVVALAVLLVATRPRWARLTVLLARTLHTSGQLAVRVVMLVLILLAWTAADLGLDMLLGAFTAGLLARLFLSGQDDRTHEQVVARLEGVGYGFLVPIFFVVSGIRFDLDALLAGGSALALVPAGLVLFLLVRGVPTYVALRGCLTGRDRLGAAVYASTALPLVVVITSLGVERDQLTEATAAGLVAAGMLSVLLFPLAATRLRRATTPVGQHAWSGGSPDAL